MVAHPGAYCINVVLTNQRRFLLLRRLSQQCGTARPTLAGFEREKLEWYAQWMALKAIGVDDQNNQHLIIGLNRENIESLLQGDVLTLPCGVVPVLTKDSDIVLLFGETDDHLAKRFPPPMRPV